MATFLSVVPHPDDEVVATGPVSLDLMLRGHSVHVLCLSLGRKESAFEETRRELELAAQYGGWNLHIPPDPVRLERGHDLELAETNACVALQEVVDRVRPDVVLSPSPHDRHPGHELTGRAARSQLRDRTGMRWWAWSLWGHLTVPTLLHPFGPQVLAASLQAHTAHETQIRRNDYREMLIGAAAVAAVLGPEQVFGYGSGVASSAPYASLFSEMVAVDGQWFQGLPRVLDVADPVGLDVSSTPADWVDGPSPYPSW